MSRFNSHPRLDASKNPFYGDILVASFFDSDGKSKDLKVMTSYVLTS